MIKRVLITLALTSAMLFSISNIAQASMYVYKQEVVKETLLAKNVNRYPESGWHSITLDKIDLPKNKWSMQVCDVYQVDIKFKNKWYQKWKYTSMLECKNGSSVQLEKANAESCKDVKLYENLFCDIYFTQLISETQNFKPIFHRNTLESRVNELESRVNELENK